MVLNTIVLHRISSWRNSETCLVRDFESIQAIRRNRLTSNWVVALHAKEYLPKPRPRRTPSQILFVMLSGLVISGLASLWPAATANKARPGGSLPATSKHSMDSSDNKVRDSCTPDSLRRQLTDVDPTSREGLEVSSFLSLSDAQNLGGELIYRATCRASNSSMVFQITWSKSALGWQLKKISRQPEGVPGD